MSPLPPARPAYDPHTQVVLDALDAAGLDLPLNDETLPQWRKPAEATRQWLVDQHPDLVIAEREIGREDGSAMTVAVVSLSQDPSACCGQEGTGAPLFLSLHGGGRVVGNRYDDVMRCVPWMRRWGGVVVSPEYRLAPEHPSPTATQDCVAALQWARTHAEELGCDPDRIIVTGPSAGGGLGMCLALAARRSDVPRALGYLLDYPMLDDRTGTAGPDGTVQPSSAAQYPWDGRWPASWNNWAWQQVLGDRRGGPEVTEADAAARATDLSGLGAVFLSVASAEVFRDEVVEMASKIWRDGGDCELHVYPGGTHAMEIVCCTWLARDLEQARQSWLERLLQPQDPAENLQLVIDNGTYPGL
ncbi:alpha/beta hydrolase [Actinomyces trachealis]|uniref:alpha/beta hydrolase n=1 Tax=Actinomyces trachealis TaxID=2763540 RepID=UPI001892D228|nr:alpha/beta hydrolase [Actinomyces trachealis]